MYFKDPPFITFSINLAIMRVFKKIREFFFHENPQKVYIKRKNNNTYQHLETYHDMQMHYSGRGGHYPPFCLLVAPKGGHGGYHLPFCLLAASTGGHGGYHPPHHAVCPGTDIFFIFEYCLSIDRGVSLSLFCSC